MRAGRHAGQRLRGLEFTLAINLIGLRQYSVTLAPSFSMQILTNASEAGENAMTPLDNTTSSNSAMHSLVNSSTTRRCPLLVIASNLPSGEKQDGRQGFDGSK